MSQCRSCGAIIRWVKTEAGKTMPVEPDDTEGNIELVYGPSNTPTSVVRPQSHDWPAGAKRWVSHFARCPQAAQHWK